MAAIVGLCSVGVNAHADTVIADSIADFSSTQGGNNWYYGFSTTPFSNYETSSFQQMGDFDPKSSVFLDRAIWRTAPQAYSWTTIWADGGHPNGSNSAGGPQLSIRRWVSEVSGVVTLTGVLEDEDAGGGNGVTGRVLANGSQIWSGTIDNGGTTSFSFSTLVANGTKIDFVLDSNGDDYYDSTRFSSQITAAVPEPESYAMLLAGLGLIASIARRRKQGR